MRFDNSDAGGGDGPRRLLGDEAYARLKEEILRCRIAPGARVSEQTLAERLGIGRGPVRTALAQLRREGLVTSVPQVGYEITHVTLKDAIELFEARELIERFAVERAAVLATPDQLHELRELAKVDCVIGNVASVEAYLRANDRFHGRLVEISENSYLARLLAGTLERMERLMYLGHMMTPVLGVENDGRHAQLVQCLTERDSEGATNVLHAHLESARERTFAALVASPALQNVNLGVVERLPQAP